MFWEITSFLLLFGATLFAPAAPLVEGISAPLRAEQAAVTAPAQDANERAGVRRIQTYGPGSRPKCNGKCYTE